jgi:hypothetical protein
LAFLCIPGKSLKFLALLFSISTTSACEATERRLVELDSVASCNSSIRDADLRYSCSYACAGKMEEFIFGPNFVLDIPYRAIRLFL